ncbi:hypothetical protein [Mycobacterium talmoniae]|uniref:Uncharacterized protein n=1 Tax=Mycobacterium talmoniae TaxID=1858794 RepID=A0A1S1NHL7_9MYCO|nr:hypothetical protein [Mycobacterium talmoniae]OHU98196.1 hypothetical protein BKN37_21055 [Mycobacterium talmoniae]
MNKDDVVFSLPDRRIVRALWLGVLAAALAWNMCLVIAAEPYRDWPAFPRLFAGAIYAAGGCLYASRARDAWRGYRHRPTDARIEQIDHPQ